MTQYRGLSNKNSEQEVLMKKLTVITTNIVYKTLHPKPWLFLKIQESCAIIITINIHFSKDPIAQ